MSSSRTSALPNEGSSSGSPVERGAPRRRNSTKSYPNAASARRGPASQSEPSVASQSSWRTTVEDVAEEAIDEMAESLGHATEFAHAPTRPTHGRKHSIKHAPPSLDDDSFEEDRVDSKDENVLGGWHYAPLLIAVIPPLGAVIGGEADAWSDAIVVLLASFWLYQFLRVPHDLYHAARTRRVLHADAYEEEQENEDPIVAQRRRHEIAAASAELRRAEMISLAALVLSPIAGAYLLTWLMDVFTDGNRFLNKFNIRLFMMASGIKPWSHALSLFRQRLLHLQEVVHYPSSKVEALNRRIVRMEADLSTLRRLVATKSDVSLLREGIDLPLTQLSRSMRRYEKKEEHLRMSSEDKFSLVESRLEDLLREVAINAELIEEERRERQRAISLPASIIQAIRVALGQRKQDTLYYEGQRTLNGHTSLGITADGHPMERSNSSGKLSSLNSSLSSNPDTNADYFAPAPSAQPTSPTMATNKQMIPLGSHALSRSAHPAWTATGLAYWLFLPITIPRCVIQGALSIAGVRNNSVRDASYAQGFAAAMAAKAAAAAASANNAPGQNNAAKKRKETHNGAAAGAAEAVTSPTKGGFPQHARMGSNANNMAMPAGGKANRSSVFLERSTASPIAATGHFSRRV